MFDRIGLVLYPHLYRKPAMMFDQQYHEELRALRNLEKAIRACGLPGVMVSGQRQLDSLAAALNEVVEARKAAIKKSVHKKV
ncbi:MAG: hypothetical protein V7642_6809 [Burkholderiales bacterium]